MIASGLLMIALEPTRIEKIFTVIVSETSGSAWIFILFPSLQRPTHLRDAGQDRRAHHLSE